MLGDLGADVVRVVPPAGDPLGGTIALAWNAGKQVVALAADDPALDALLADADVVIDELGAAGTHQLDPGRAPQAVWVRISPFGARGPARGVDARPTSASWRRRGTCTAPAIPTARRSARPSRPGTRTPGPRPRSRR